ncbi:MAG: hypothetical protein QMC89_05210 [Candidatus Hodarchaeaceae archaeon]|nr:hypothetical protein [Candidatus Hodarchaeaceae archaeon]
MTIVAEFAGDELHEGSTNRKKEVAIILLAIVISTCLWLVPAMRSTPEPLLLPSKPPEMDERSIGNPLTLEEVKERASFPILIPTYVPEGIQLEEIRGLRGHLWSPEDNRLISDNSYWEFRFFFSKENLVLTISRSYQKMTLEGLKRAFVEEYPKYRRLVEINGSPGFVQESHVNLVGEQLPVFLDWWNNDLYLKFAISGFLPSEELIRMAESLRPA